MAWFDYLQCSSKIDEEMKTSVHSFLSIDHWRSKIDTVFLFTTDAETSLKREHAETLIKSPGRAMNEDVLKELNRSYSKLRSDLGGVFTIRDIDTSGDSATTPTSTSYEVTGAILNTLAPQT